MTNEKETIDRVKGEWRTVTKASEGKDGQRVRYDGNHCRFGYSDSLKHRRIRIVGKGLQLKELLYTCWDGEVQAFFPLPVRKSRKVAKVRIYQNERSGFYSFETWINNVMCEKRLYSARSHAIRGARRFCKAIGYECEIVK